MRTFLTLIILSLFATLQAQPRGESVKERTTFGGNVGFSFGQTTVVNISPRIGYYVTDQFVPGIALTYQYYKRDNYTDTRYGGSAFARYFIMDELFVQAESEMLKTNVLTEARDGITYIERKWINSTMVGGGYKSGPISISAMYIINHDPATSPYGKSPIVVQGGIMF